MKVVIKEVMRGYEGGIFWEVSGVSKGALRGA